MKTNRYFVFSRIIPTKIKLIYESKTIIRSLIVPNHSLSCAYIGKGQTLFPMNCCPSTFWIASIFTETCFTTFRASPEIRSGSTTSRKICTEIFRRTSCSAARTRGSARPSCSGSSKRTPWSTPSKAIVKLRLKWRRYFSSFCEKWSLFAAGCRDELASFFKRIQLSCISEGSKLYGNCFEKKENQPQRWSNPDSIWDGIYYTAVPRL